MPLSAKRNVKKLIYCVLIFLSFYSNAQNDTAKQEFLSDSLKIIKHDLVRLQFKLDSRVIFFNFQKLGLIGLDAGVLIKEKLRLTLGYYTISDKSTTIIQKTIHNVAYQGQYTLSYGAFNSEFIYKNKPLYSLGVPIEVGLGSNRLNYVSNLPTYKKEGIIAVTYFGLSGGFKPIKWLGLKAALGFRKTMFNQIRGLSFDGFYYSIGLVVDFGEVVIRYKLYKLKKKYHKANSIETAVDLITN